jgi:hypothetical protein
VGKLVSKITLDVKIDIVVSAIAAKGVIFALALQNAISWLGFDVTSALIAVADGSITPFS